MAGKRLCAPSGRVWQWPQPRKQAGRTGGSPVTGWGSQGSWGPATPSLPGVPLQIPPLLSTPGGWPHSLISEGSNLYMNLAGSRLPPGSDKHGCKGKCHFKATFRRPQSVQRNEQQTFTDTRMFFFSLSQEVWWVVGFKTVHFTVHFFF